MFKKIRKIGLFNLKLYKENELLKAKLEAAEKQLSALQEANKAPKKKYYRKSKQS